MTGTPELEYEKKMFQLALILYGAFLLSFIILLHPERGQCPLFSGDTVTLAAAILPLLLAIPFSIIFGDIVGLILASSICLLGSLIAWLYVFLRGRVRFKLRSFD